MSDFEKLYRKMYAHDPELADVLIAQETFVREKVSRGADRALASANPLGPFFVWSAKANLVDYGEQFAAGRPHALMIAIRICANHDLPLPAWASAAYIRAFDNVNHYVHDSWDEVFGNPPAQGKKRQKLRFEVEHGYAIFQEICERSRSGASRDDILFEEVGENHGVKATRVKEIWQKYKAMPWTKSLIPADKPKRRRRIL